jgi:DNA polymerase-3 subunit delta'
MTALEPSTHAPVLDRVIGQPGAVALLRGSVPRPVHAYLFLGPPGTGRLDAAVAFAAALICPDGGCGVCIACTEVLARRHPDLAVIEREGASISVSQAHEVARTALRTPRSGAYQVLVLVDFHLVGSAAPALLKTIEEPPDTTVIIVIAESIPRPFVTIASRCLQVAFDPLSDSAIVEVLLGEGVDPATASSVAGASTGRLDRARLLAVDEGFAARLERWRTVPGRLDGTGARVVELVDELRAAADEPVEVVRVLQAAELAQLAAVAEQRGDRGIPGRQAIDDRHKREQRRVRTDELRAGMATLAATYRERLLGPEVSSQRLAGTLGALETINDASSRLGRNVNEPMLLQWLLLRLDR